MGRIFLDTLTSYLSCINFNFSFTLAFTLRQVWFIWLHWKVPCLNRHSAKTAKEKFYQNRSLQHNLKWMSRQMSAYSFALIICSVRILAEVQGGLMLPGVSSCKTNKSPEEAPEDCCLQLDPLCLSETEMVTQDSDHMSSFPVLSSPVSPHLKATDSFTPRTHFAIK